MSVYGIALVKDEADIIAQTVRHMATQVDHLLVADNMSTDGTRDILSDLARELPLTVIDDTDVAHYQARKLTALSHRAADMGADWVAPFDADELVSSPLGRLGDVMGQQKRRVWVLSVALLEYRPTTSDPDNPDPYARIGWRKAQPNVLPKVVCRCHPDLWIGEGSHTAHYAGVALRSILDAVVTRHFPYRSAEQFVSKMRNGSRGRNATDLPPEVGVHLREHGRILAERGPAALERIYWQEHVIHDAENDPTMIFDPVA